MNEEHNKSIMILVIISEWLPGYFIGDKQHYSFLLQKNKADKNTSLIQKELYVTAMNAVSYKRQKCFGIICSIN